jgi:hypothetical protein
MTNMPWMQEVTYCSRDIETLTYQEAICFSDNVEAFTSTSPREDFIAW